MWQNGEPFLSQVWSDNFEELYLVKKIKESLISEEDRISFVNEALLMTYVFYVFNDLQYYQAP
jgi:hypothetical protein